MTRPVILLVESDDRAARSIVAAFDRRLIPRPVRVTTGEDAVVWARANQCDACVISQNLPGIDGLETFLRIHQRFPSLPVVMLGGRESEQAAVAAFRAGVADYVPRQSAYPDVAADKIHELLRRDGESWAVAAPVVGKDESNELLRGTYQNRLRAIGRQLDLYSYRSINVMEVGGGILVRAASPGSRAPEALEFRDGDFPQMLHSGIAARGEQNRPRTLTRLLPTGYEDFLRAVGYRLDEQAAGAATVTELHEFFAVGGVGMIDERGQTAIGPFQWLLYTDDITYILNEAYRRRDPAAQEKRSAFSRITGRH